MRPSIWLLLPILAVGAAAPARARDLQPETIAAFDRYVALTEARIHKQVSDPNVFLYIDTLPAAERNQAFAALKGGELYIAALATRDASGREIEVPDGLVHHWVGAVFIPGVSMASVLKVVEDYDHKQDDYPEVVRSRLLRRSGNRFQAAMRFREHRVITIMLDADFDVTYTEVDPSHWYATSASTQVQQVENAGQPGEHDLPDGQGDGFLWRLDTYWRYVEQDGGVYVEVEAVSLTRDVPTGLGWLIKPFITSVPRESLKSTLESTRAAVLKRVKE
ncbi:MAG TPA: hypothetical protein VL523_08320 [Terriglobia bacterium]|nr:hypothetical protein [Terriglobia bacterium]